MVTIHIAAALICFAEICQPALVGRTTPPGEYKLTYALTEAPGFDGNVLVFKEDEKDVFAIHRLWLLNPKQKREQRIKSSNPRDRVITAGCVNVSTEVFDQLVECCKGSPLTIVH